MRITALSALAKGGVGSPVGGSVSAGLPKPASGLKKTADSANLTVLQSDTTLERAPVVQAPSTTPAKTPAKTPATTTSTTAATNSSPVRQEPAPKFNGGKFKAEYSDGGKSVTGQAGIFKSTSGWQDGKYYALMNNVPVGTIVKVTDAATTRSIFAKVLGQLPDMKESAGLSIRISNAAASELGAADGRFNVEMKY